MTTTPIIHIPKNVPLIVFDGICVLCNRSVQFILKFEKTDNLIFTTFQSAYFKEFTQNQHQLINANSVILIENGTIYTESDAALKIAKYLKFFNLFFYLFIWWPKKIRNAAYRLIARNRYSWFGTRETCMIPKSDQKHRFFI